MLGKRRSYSSKKERSTSQVKKVKPSTAVTRLNNKLTTVGAARNPTMTTLMRWCDVGRSVDPGIASCAAYIYSLNGLYDPNITGVGDQPTGFDQYMALYDLYTVLAVKVKVKVLNGDGTYPQICGATVAGLASAQTDPNIYIRNGTPQYHVVGPLGAYMNIREWQFDVDLTKLAKTNIKTDPDYSGTAGTNPPNQWYLHIWNGAHDGTSNAGQCYWQVEFEYLVQLRDPATAPNS